MIIFRSFAFYLALAGLGVALVLMRIINTNPPQQVPPRQPSSNPYVNAIAASGIIEAADRNIAIGAPSSGLITNVYVKVSDSVKKGQPLFKMDSRELRAQLLLQKANIKVSEANLKRLQDQLDRLEHVSDPRAVSRDLIETRENDVKVAEAQLDANIAEVKRTQQLIDRLFVLAPKDGVILQNNIRIGEYHNTSAADPAMILGDISKLQVRVDIDEQNASRFNPAYIATAYPKNNTQLKIPLTFDRIEPYVIPKKSLTGSSTERVDTRVLQVIYTFKEPENFNVYVGQQVDVFIEEKSSDVQPPADAEQLQSL